jgi:dienelactone hydrolase
MRSLTAPVLFLIPHFLLRCPAKSAVFQTSDFEKGRIIDKVVCTNAPQFSYSLYLPSGYSAERNWPVIFCFDPRAQGRRPVELLQAAAETYGYVLAGSLDSKNGPVEPNQRAARAVWQDVRGRFSIDTERVYAAGFSGGAEVAVLFPYLVEARAAGIISCGAGLPAGHEPGWVKPAAYYGIIGNWDFRYLDMDRLEEPFASSGVIHRIVTYDGWHQWPSPEAFSAAVEWLELMAMKSGIKEKESRFIDAQVQKRLEAAASLETTGRTLDVLREYKSLALDFKGLIAGSEIEDKLEALKGSADVPKLERDKQAAQESERAAQARMPHIFTAVQEPISGRPPYRLNDVVRALDLDSWASVSAQTKNRFLSDAAKRLLSQVAILADQHGIRAKSAGDLRLAVLMFELATRASAGHPMNPGEFYNLACAYAVSGKAKDALKALRTAVEKGFDDIERLESEKDLDSVRNSPLFKSLLDELRSRKRALLSCGSFGKPGMHFSRI